MLNSISVLHYVFDFELYFKKPDIFSSTALDKCALCVDIRSSIWEKTVYWSRTGWHTEQTL